MAEQTHDSGRMRLQEGIIPTCSQPGDEDTACPAGPHGNCICEQAGAVGGRLCNDKKVGGLLLFPQEDVIGSFGSNCGLAENGNPLFRDKWGLWPVP